ncbi:hypothetical protein EVAR_46703_1 [Eumeta japonica]|uniref:Uncharacterized protein n=1 Tax=Eumeta variegata TaxID=151549 RepID=A0A4C1XE78_EUMVA|nr:hypothetical protein EVAR_46703_1 [Eumeta japonica]
MPAMADRPRPGPGRAARARHSGALRVNDKILVSAGGGSGAPGRADGVGVAHAPAGPARYSRRLNFKLAARSSGIPFLLCWAQNSLDVY